MRWLLFPSRLALICNGCFVLALSIRLWAWLPPGDLSGTIGVLGYFIVFFLNGFVVLCYLLAVLTRRPLFTAVPLWLVIANTVFCILQLVYIFSP